MPRASFTLFPQLPPEIRSRIWCIALRMPRYIEIRSNLEVGTRGNFRRLYDRTWRPVCTEQVPSMVWSCKEAMGELGQIHQSLKGTQSEKPAVWCSYETDVICFWGQRFYGRFWETLLNLPHKAKLRIKTIAVDYGVQCVVSNNDPRFQMGSLRHLPNLTEIQVACWLRGPRGAHVVGFEEYKTIPKSKETWSAHFISALEAEAKSIREVNPEWKAPRIKFGKYIRSMNFSAPYKQRMRGPK